MDGIRISKSLQSMSKTGSSEAQVHFLQTHPQHDDPRDDDKETNYVSTEARKGNVISSRKLMSEDSDKGVNNDEVLETQTCMNHVPIDTHVSSHVRHGLLQIATCILVMASCCVLMSINTHELIDISCHTLLLGTDSITKNEQFSNALRLTDIDIKVMHKHGGLIRSCMLLDIRAYTNSVFQIQKLRAQAQIQIGPRTTLQEGVL